MKTRGCNIGSFLQTRSGVAAVLLSVAMAAVATPARADSISIGFEGPSYVVGSIDGQQGWGGQTPPGIAVDTNIDQGVSGSTPGHTGSQSYRESSFYTTGSFGNQVFSPSLTDRAGEASSAADGLAGGTLQQRFMSTVWFKPTVIVPQDSHVVYSADRGDGARMTWMQVSDNVTDPGDGRQGLSVSFNDYKVPSGTEPACAGPDNAADGEGKCFVFHVLSTNLSRTDWHRIDMEIGFYDGAANDVVRASVDGVELYVGTTWEDYFRNQEGNPTRPVDSLLFRVGGTAEGISGQGFLFDDISYASGPCLASTRYVTTTGSDTFNDCRNIGSPCATVQHGVDVACVGDTVEVGAGTFTEQVAIPKSVTVHGTGAATTKIQAPAIMPAAPGNSIVVVSGPSTTAAIKNLTVAGPGSTGCNSIRAGIDVRDSASASILDDAVVDIRDTPFGGCQNGIGILVGSVSLGYDGHAVIQNTTVSGHQKAGIVVVNSGSTATIQGNVITGVGPTPFIAENGIQVSDGAKASVTQNVISGHECNHATCGADPINDYQSAGILLIDAGTPTTVSGNTVSANDIGIYHYTTAVAATTITNNTVSGTRFEGVFIDQGTANVTNNKITGGNYGVLAVAFTGSTGNSTATLTCNQVQSTGVGIGLIDDDTIGDTNVPSITAHNNQIAGNTIGVKNTTTGPVNATGNYWGSGTGPNPPGSGDTLVGPVTGVPFLTTLPNCIACTTNGDCANGIGCDGAEVCNAGVCQPGTPVTCGPPTQCQISVDVRSRRVRAYPSRRRTACSARTGRPVR